MNMIRLYYVSTADAAVTFDDARQIAEHSRNYNSKWDITGAMAFNGSNFAQVLEGPQTVVQHLYAKIAHDPRHAGISVIGSKTVGERAFADWSMRFVEGLDFAVLQDSMDRP